MLPPLRRNSAQVDSISSFSNNFTKRTSDLERNPIKDLTEFFQSKIRPLLIEKNTTFRPDRKEKFGPKNGQHFPLILSKLQKIDSISCFFLESHCMQTEFRRMVDKHMSPILYIKIISMIKCRDFFQKYSGRLKASIFSQDGSFSTMVLSLPTFF